MPVITIDLQSVITHQLSVNDIGWWERWYFCILFLSQHLNCKNIYKGEPIEHNLCVCN